MTQDLVSRIEKRLSASNLDPSLSGPILHFWGSVLDENSRQNLTRLVSDDDFMDSHLEDALVLNDSGWLGSRALDFGSGGGVPGALNSIIRGTGGLETDLLESEIRKAQFLASAIESGGLLGRAIHSRVEAHLRSEAYDSLFCRAVGPVGRILGWIGGCSTWNNLVLFKGPKWEEELLDFNNSRWKSKYQVGRRVDYQSPVFGKSRTLVEIVRL